MTKPRVAVAVVAAAIALVPACSGIGNPDTASGEGTVLTMAYVPDPKLMPQYLEGEVERFERANPGVDIKLQSVPSTQFANTVELQAGQGTPPDIFRLPPAAQFIERSFARGWLRDLSPYVTADYKKRFPAGTFDEKTGGLHRDGKLIGVPMVNGDWTGTAVLYYNPDILAEYGFDKPPATYAELESMARTITEQSDNSVYGYGLASQPELLANSVNFYQFSAGDPVSKGINPQTGQAGYGQPNVTEAVEFYQRLVENEAVAPGWQNFTAQDIWPLFVQGKVAMFVNYVWMYPELLRLDPDFELKVAPPPASEGGKASVYTESRTLPYWGVSSATEHPDIAWKFLDFLTTNDSQARFYETVGAPPALSEQLADKLDPDLRSVLELGTDSRLLLPSPRLASPEGRKISDALSDKVSPTQYQDALMDAVTNGKPWGPIAQQLDADVNAAIDDVIDELNANGEHVSRSDLAFPNWDPAESFAG